jgi:ABC-2 type transport system ATP-binding protein
MTHDPALKTSQLVVRYGELSAVDHLDLEVRRGECFGLLGPNGAGKTTTVEALEGLIRPSAGRVEVLGHTWGDAGDRPTRERMGVALQETRLPDLLTVEEVLRLFSALYRRRRDLDEVIDLLGLQEKRAARVGKLSGGQRQRVALACALVGDPEVLFLDEPTTGLDPQARLRIWEVLRDFTAEGGTVLVTTHYMDEAARLCDRVGVIDHGRLIALDSPGALIRMLGAEQVIELEVDGEFPREQIAALAPVRRVERRGQTWVLLVEEVAQAATQAMALLADQDLSIRSLATHQATLDDVFVHLTGRGIRDA